MVIAIMHPSPQTHNVDVFNQPNEQILFFLGEGGGTKKSTPNRKAKKRNQERSPWGSAHYMLATDFELGHVQVSGTSLPNPQPLV